MGALRGRGIDAYGVSDSIDRYSVDPDVQFGRLMEHLQSVDDSALRAVVVVGLLSGPGTDEPSRIAGQMHRAAPTSIVVSEAPWWWRERVGSVAADISPLRPFGPETWLEALAGAGFAVDAGYRAGGTTYVLVARR